MSLNLLARQPGAVMTRRAQGEAPQAFVKAGERPLFELVLRPEPRVNSERALRALLKYVLRSHGLRCISIKRVRPK
jgi:hypothetical protein